MALPPANLVLFFLSAFVGLWGASVVVRGMRGGAVEGTRRCPECLADLRGVEGRRCAACGFEAESEEDLKKRRGDLRIVTVGAVFSAAGVGLLAIAMWVRAWEGTGNFPGAGVHPLVPFFVGVGAFGLVLCAWAWRGDRSRGRRRCPKCWYDMSATLSGRDRVAETALVCPECGHDAVIERRLYRPRRRTGAIWLGVALVACALYGQAVPRALRVGPLGLAPTTVLIAGMRWLPAAWCCDTSGRREEATLEGRLGSDLTWEWQARWARARARSLLENGLSVERFVSIAELLDSDDYRDRAAAIVACARLAGDPARRLSARESKLLLDGVPLYWWEDPDWAAETRRLRAAVREHLPALLERSVSGGDDEATLSLVLIGVLDRLPEDSIEAIALSVRRGSASRQRAAAFAIGGGRVDLDAVLALIEELLTEDGSQYKHVALWAMRSGLYGSSRPEMRRKLLGLLRTHESPELASIAATALANAGMDSEALRRWISPDELSPAARAGLAESWRRNASLLVDDAMPIVLPALESGDSDQVFAVLGFIAAKVGDERFPASDVMSAVSPLLQDEDGLVAVEAAHALSMLAHARPEFAASIEEALRAAGLTLEETDAAGSKEP